MKPENQKARKPESQKAREYYAWIIIQEFTGAFGFYHNMLPVFIDADSCGRRFGVRIKRFY